MKLLLDTHTWLWAFQNNPRLSKRAARLITDARNRCFFSIVSCWELVLLEAAGKIKKLKLDELPQYLEADRIEVLALELAHLLKVPSLPRPANHKDGFDRLLVAQAMTEDLTLVTRDGWIDAYDVRHAW